MIAFSRQLRHILLSALLATAPAFAQTTPAATPPPDALPDSPSAQTGIQTGTHPPATPPSQLPDSPGTATAPIVPTGPTVVLDTTSGRLTCKLYDQQSPLAAANFLGLAEGTKPFTDPVTGKQITGTRFYDGTTFHRVIPAFMIQGGDRRGDGTGDPGYAFANEDTPGLTFDVAGRLAMANSGPDTNGSQFFITELPQPELDHKYTIFGQCDTHSVLLVATIARVDRDSQDKPLTPVVLRKVTIVREGQPMPPEPTVAAAPAGNGLPGGVSPMPPPH